VPLPAGFIVAVTDRDENAAKNICMVGASTIELGDVRRAMQSDRCLNLESPHVHVGEYVKIECSWDLPHSEFNGGILTPITKRSPYSEK